MLRCVAKTYVTFRDHDSAGAGIRIEAWSELAINDYLYVGGELMRIRELPRNPDDDCQFFSAGGQRLGYLGTTPTHHPLGEPMYKVTIHPPGTTFPPNGLPVVDAALPQRRRRPRLRQGLAARLRPAGRRRVPGARRRRPRPGRPRLRLPPDRPPAAAGLHASASARPPRPCGRAAPCRSRVNAERLDGFDGPIDVRLENLPPGFSAPATNDPRRARTAPRFALFAEPTAADARRSAPPLKLVARATIDGKEVVREAAGGLPKVIDRGDIVTTTEQSEVTVQPGGEARLTVTVERRNGFAGRIPLDVRGLPHGVRVLDIGLNGILITEKETTRDRS